MTERPTDVVTQPFKNDLGVWRYPIDRVRHWSKRSVPSLWKQWWTALSGPWGRFYGAVATALVFVLRPTTWPTLAFIGVVVWVTSLGRRHPLLYLLPAGVVGVAMGGADWLLAALGGLAGGHHITKRLAQPDPLPMRLHLRLARLTGAPTDEDYRRLETYNEAFNRVTTLGRGHALAKRMLVRDKRPIDPVRARWIRVDYTPPIRRRRRDRHLELAAPAYPVLGFWARWPATSKDDDPTWREEFLSAAAAKLPPMPDGHPPVLVPTWRADQDEGYFRVARPLPQWVDLQDLPADLPWPDVVPFGRVSPDSPLAAFPDPDDPGMAVACWNPDNQQCPVSLTPGVVVAGPPGSYKTATARTLIRGARDHLGVEFGGARVVAIDGKQEGAFNYLKGQHDCTAVTDPAQAKAQLKAVVEEMRARYQINETLRDAGQPLAVYQPIVVVIDEGMSLLDKLANDPQITDIMEWIVDLGRLGRLARCFPIWLTQRPDVRGIQNYGTVGQFRDMLELKLGGAGLTETGAQMIYGASNGKLANQIPKKPRARMGMMVGSQFTLVQLAYTPDPLGPRDDEPGPLITSARDHAHALANDPNTPIGFVVQAAEQAAEQAADQIFTARRNRTMTP